MNGTDAFFSFVRSLLARRWVRFGMVGGTAALCYALLGLLFVNVLGLPALVGNGLAYVLSFVVSSLGQSLWTFSAPHTKAAHSAMLPRFAATQALGLTLNTLIVWLLMSLGLKYETAMPIALLLVPVVVYAACKYWVFRPRPAARSHDNP